MVCAFIRCIRCGMPVKPKGQVGRPPKYCHSCIKNIKREIDRITKQRQRDNVKKYLFNVERLLNYRKSQEIDYCVTPFGLYKRLGSRDSTTSSLNERERELLKGTPEENWRNE